MGLRTSEETQVPRHTTEPCLSSSLPQGVLPKNTVQRGESSANRDARNGLPESLPPINGALGFLVRQKGGLD